MNVCVLVNSLACGRADIALFNKFITGEKRGSKSHVLVAIDRSLRGIIFNTEDGSSRFLRNVTTYIYVQNSTASVQRALQSEQTCDMKNIKECNQIQWCRDMKLVCLEQKHLATGETKVLLCH